MVSFGLVLFSFGLFSLIYNRKHILVLLLSLELIILGVFIIMMNYALASIVELIVFYLVLVVCEARLGLGVLVIRVYFYGRDHLSSYNVLRC